LACGIAGAPKQDRAAYYDYGGYRNQQYVAFNIGKYGHILMIHGGSRLRKRIKIGQIFIQNRAKIEVISNKKGLDIRLPAPT